MNTPVFQEVAIKEKRLLDFLDLHDYDAAVIGRAENFAWITGGGENRVVLNSEIGFSYLVITREKKTVVSLIADGEKVLIEELEGLGYSLDVLKWYEKSKESRVLELVEGLHVISDIPLPSVDFKPSSFYPLYYPLTENEVQKYRLLGKLTEQILYDATYKIKPGMTEYQVQGMLAGMYGEQNIDISVMLIGSDYRIGAYRHCLPSNKEIEKLLLISPAVKKWGLHANVARMICFGEIPEDTKRRYEAVKEIEAESISLSTPGRLFSEILAVQKKMYHEFGFGDEWQNHFQGGVTGYMVSDPTLCMDKQNKLIGNQSYDWFITITGAKGEELTLNVDGTIEVPTVNGVWPTKTYKRNNILINLPDIIQF